MKEIIAYLIVEYFDLWYAIFCCIVMGIVEIILEGGIWDVTDKEEPRSERPSSEGLPRNK
jgi:hypothetical protein